jgi:hypothetical protein
MEGIPNNKIEIENKATEESRYEDIKGVIMRKSQEIIGCTVDKLWQENKLMGRVDISEENFILEVLKYISPKNEKMWYDEEMVMEVRKIMREKFSKKKENISNSDQEKNKRRFKVSKKMRADAYRHEKALGGDKDND